MTKKLTLCLATLSAAALFACPAVAQDLSVPQPNVMLLVDTSGSMEYKSAETAFPKCDPTSSDPADNERSRWIELVEVLTGTIDDYRCTAVNRRSSTFLDEYQLSSTVAPPDYQYRNPYHRPLSGTCAMGPGTVNTTDAFAWSEPSCHAYDNLNASCTIAGSCDSFKQSGDGIIDAYGSGIRFGLMTFDSLISPKTGYSGSAPNLSDGVEGAWSYYVNDYTEGKPVYCDALYPYEVGARNAAAPPWEGRMVAFGNPNPQLSDHKTRNAEIEKILLTTRPYGATPVAGLLADALDFFTEDSSQDPLDNSLKFGPKSDPYVTGDCRTQHIILLTDGEPNLDLRPYCAQAPQGDGAEGVCPYDETQELAKDLFDAGVTVHVIGFALEDVTYNGTETGKCGDIDTDVLLGANGDSGVCAGDLSGNKPLQVCCELSMIAYEGSQGEDKAHFAGNQSDLREAIKEIIGKFAPRVSLTQPAVASGSSFSTSNATSYRFYSATRPDSISLWRGELERQRYQCSSDGLPEAQDVDATKGDDFSQNLTVNRQDRTIISVEAEADSNDNTKIYSNRSIRPNIETTPADGIDSLDWSGDSDVRASASSFGSTIDARALRLNTADASCTGYTESQCAEHIMDWVLGVNSTSDDYHRCASSSECNLLGPILRSTPQVVGRPNALILDESYDAFKLTRATRDLVLYTSTNDGFLHAFRVASGDPAKEDDDDANVRTLTNNELWAFIPPAVLTGMQTQYPGAHQILLDGEPVIKDVVASPDDVRVFERTSETARFAVGLWRTVLVQAFGGSRGGYFALDVTDPVITGDSGGPRFLWQLTTDSDGNALFGDGGGTPLITTVFMNDGVEEKEIAVAILPGGEGTRDDGADPVDRTASIDFVDSDYTPRSQLPVYTTAASRSLTVVRLDNGEIIKTFRPDADDVPDLDEDAISETPIDSPITGTPVAFPAEVGAVADRVFVGDQEGALWRLDLSEPDPDDWTFSLFYDAFPEASASGDLAYEPRDGQPIATRPIISTDGNNQLVVLFSTGDQESLFASESDNFLVSLTEAVDEADDGTQKFVSKVNWYKKFENGKRVTGPMVLFSSQLYAATFAGAPAGDVCAGGTSTVWGMHFLERANAEDASAGGLPLWKQNDGTMIQEKPADEDNPDTIVFGLTLAQQPSCITAPQTPVGDDPFLSFGTHTSTQGLNPGKFQLIMHTGKMGGGDISAQAADNTTAIDLETPTSITRIDSWAAIVE